jgi:hypothetical protein
MVSGFTNFNFLNNSEAHEFFGTLNIRYVYSPFTTHHFISCLSKPKATSRSKASHTSSGISW